MDEARPDRARCGAKLELLAIPGVPLIEAGDDLGAVLARALREARFELRDGDVAVVASKVVSRSEGRFVDLQRVEPSERARDVGARIGKDPRLVELILRDSERISRSAPGVLIVRHRLGFVSANAGIDCSNAVPANAAAGSGPWALLLPESPDASAERVRKALFAASNAQIGVVVSDSF